MKGKFTKMMAALALLMGLAVPIGMWGQTTYERLTSIANIDESAQYVLGIDGTGFHYSGTSSWGLTALPSAQTPIYYTLTKANDGNSFTAKATISGTLYYLQVPTSNTFSMATSTGTNTDLIIGTTQISETNYAVANKGNTNRHLRINGTSGLRSYAGTTGTMAYFYKVVVPSGNTYTVTYHANVTGATDIVETYNEGATVTIADNTFSNPGYAFTEWNTESDGSGDPYNPGDEIEDIDDDLDLYAQWEESDEATYDFTQIEGFSSWGNGYNDHEVEYSDATVTFYAASHQTGTITDRPVTKAGPVTLVMTDESTLNGVTFVLTQWGSKTKTVELFYSTDGGENYTSTSITSSNFTITCNSLPAGTNAVKIGFSETSNQVGIASATIVKNNASDPRTPTTTSITVPDGFNTDIYLSTTAGTLTASVYAGETLLEGATVTWASSNTAVATVAANGAVTLVGVGDANITADYAGDETNYKPSQGIYQLTVTSSEPVPGTLDDPYTVAEARAAIDAGTGITNVYATGIISQVDSYNSQYHSITYWISADGATTSDQLEVYSGKGLNNTNFSSVNDVAVGATVVIYGTLKKYGDVYEFDKNNYLVSYEAPTVAVEAPTFSPVAGTYAETQTVTISCETAGATIYYTTDGSTPNNNSTEYTAAFNVATTTTIKAIAIKGNDQSTVATATYHIGNSQANPYTVAQALAFNEYPTPGIYVHGIVSTAPTQAPTSDGQLTYYISVDGEATNQLEVYKGLGLEQAAFTAQDDIQVGDIVTVYGNVVIYNEIKEFATGNYLVSFERPQIIEPNVITAGTLSHVTISGLWDGDTFDDITLGDEVEEGTYVYFSLEVEEGYTLESVSVLNANNEEVTLTEASESWYFIMPNSSVTINASATHDPVPPITGDKYVKVTSTTDLTDGQYLIVYEDGGLAFDGSLETLDAVKNTIAVTISNNEIAVTETTAASEFTINTTEGTIMSASGYYIGQTSDANGLASSTETQYTNTISFDDGDANIVSSGAYLRYNSASNQLRFRYYKSSSYTGQKAIQLYKKVETTPAGIPLVIEPGQWYLIASPVGTISPEIVGNMTPENAFALYSFDQNGDSEGKEWLNYKNSDNGSFNLEEGKGYLYAHSGDNTVTLTFTGTPNQYDINNNVLPLIYNPDADLAGYNLLGNPFNETVYISGWPYYVMNEDGDAIIEGQGGIAPKQGFFVIAEGEDQSVNLSNEPTEKGASVALNLSRNRGNVIDRARVRFDESRQLPKFQLFENSTKVYIPQNGKDYAVVRSEGQGELPVNFRAAENGTYTLSIDAENMDMNYLHLIDNMTGMDVDLLQTPSYTFEANVNDYESRFRLVFAANNEDGASTGSASFAFFSNGSLVINNEGNATLQVVDLTGRILSSESINGSVSTTLNAPTGVYMLRLINGDNVKVQKIVVR